MDIVDVGIGIRVVGRGNSRRFQRLRERDAGLLVRGPGGLGPALGVLWDVGNE